MRVRNKMWTVGSPTNGHDQIWDLRADGPIHQPFHSPPQPHCQILFQRNISCSCRSALNLVGVLPRPFVSRSRSNLANPRPFSICLEWSSSLVFSICLYFQQYSVWIAIRSVPGFLLISVVSSCIQLDQNIQLFFQSGFFVGH